MTRLPLPLVLVLCSGCADLTAPSPSSSKDRPATAATAVEPAAPPAPAPAPRPDQPGAARPGTEKVRASHVLVAYQGARRSSATRSKDEAKKLADSLIGRLQGGAKFEDVATQHSDDPSAKARGGDLGSFDRFTMTKAFADAAFGLKIGQLSGVVETEFGFHIIKRTE